MLLIASDMFKTLWYLAYAAKQLVDDSALHGGPPVTSPFCYASGFLLAFGIEAGGLS